jgi:hypothetical protein
MLLTCSRVSSWASTVSALFSSSTSAHSTWRQQQQQQQQRYIAVSRCVKILIVLLAQLPSQGSAKQTRMTWIMVHTKASTLAKQRGHVCMTAAAALTCSSSSSAMCLCAPDSWACAAAAAAASGDTCWPVAAASSPCSSSSGGGSRGSSSSRGICQTQMDAGDSHGAWHGSRDGARHTSGT